ncbi:hypothetical protein BSFA1_32520 [Burkholderia sp. SFA1]|nr:hypothetical protein BSFA1_32520 [Burkholderia sp. SFA1]
MGVHPYSITSRAKHAHAIRTWFASGKTDSLRLGLADRQTFFAFHWAAEQMPQDSECFSDIDSEGCAADLARWLSEVRSGNAKFSAAYREEQMRLGLPPLRD